MKLLRYFILIFSVFSILIPINLTEDISANAQSTPQWTYAAWGNGGNFTVIEIDPNNKNIMWAGADVGGPFKSTDGGEHWKIENTGYNCSDVVSVAITPGNGNRVFALCSRGLYKTENGGANWAKVNAPISFGWLSCEKRSHWWWSKLIAINPQNTNEVYVGSTKSYKSDNCDTSSANYKNGGGLWKSTNGGNSFTHVSGNIASAGVNDIDVGGIAIDPSNPNIVYLGQREGSLRISRNGGSTWETKSSVYNISSIAVAPSNPNRVYAAHKDGNVYRSDDKGINWTGAKRPAPADLPSSFSGRRVGALTVDKTDANRLYLGLGDGRQWPQYQGQALFQSTNGGDTWSRIDNKPLIKDGNPYNNRISSVQGVEMIAIDPDDFNTVYLGSFVGLLKSTKDNNNNINGWRLINNGTYVGAVNRIVFDPNDPNRVYAAGGDSIMMYSRDYGQTWKQVWSEWGQSKGLGVANVSGQTTLYYSNDDDKGNNRGEGHWHSIIRKITRSKLDEELLKPDPNFNTAWTPLTNGLPDLVPGSGGGYPWAGGAVDIITHPDNPATIFAALRSYGIYRSTDAGNSWSRLVGNDYLSLAPSSMALGKDNQNNLYIYAGGHLWFQRSTNGGQNWTSLPHKDLIHDIAVHPTNPRIVYVTNQCCVYRSENAGDTWETVFRVPNPEASYEAYPFEPESVIFNENNPNQVFIAFGSNAHYNGPGVYVSDETGKNFTPFGTGLPRLTNAQLFFDKGRNVLWVGSQTGAFKVSLDGSTPPPTTTPLPTATSAPSDADINLDNKVNNDDIQLLFSNWITPSANPRSDINHDGKVNNEDYALILQNWRN